MKLSCACGQLRGHWTEQGPAARLECYCRDCRAFARWLGRDGLLNEAGGVSIVSVAARSVEIDQGHEHLACTSLSPKGLARWYASCCRTPVGNTLRVPHLPFLGMSRSFVKVSDSRLLKTFGPVRWQAFPHRALAPLPALPTRSLFNLLKLPTGLLAERLRGHRATGAFFDEQNQLRQIPVVLTAEQRAELADRDAA